MLSHAPWSTPLFLLLLALAWLPAQDPPQAPDFPCSVAGFFPAPVGPRTVAGFHQGWRFLKSGVAGDAPAQPGYDDRAWEIVNVPHAPEILPRNASGGANYQGPMWYRKRFTVEAFAPGTRQVLYFEAVMGRCRVYLDGALVQEHCGGYLPFAVDLTGRATAGRHVLAVWADNGNDASYPPGKPQENLDFCYFGGIYRDVWLITTGPVHITDANAVDVVAGGGVFLRTREITRDQAVVDLSVHVQNHGLMRQGVAVDVLLLDSRGTVAAKTSAEGVTLPAEGAATVPLSLTVAHPSPWTPETPALYQAEIRVRDDRQTVVDAVRVRTGLRTLGLDSQRGLILNGQPYPFKLMGANRHQDYGYVGNAMTNNLHARDARLFRAAGLRSIRSAHYPQDPAFMDACDELGLLVLVATPGWQFWNSQDPQFGQRVFQDIRHMIRRDRNRPSVLMWECVLNETRYPESFAAEAHRICHEEYPFPGCFTACDDGMPGMAAFDVVFAKESLPGRVTFTREYSSNVDDFTAQNSDDRIPRSAGERAMLVQGFHHLDNAYLGYQQVDYAKLSSQPPGHLGGTLWPGIEYQRGYLPKPQYGGLLDVFRYPKYSYAMMQCQRDPAVILPGVDSGPALFIASELTTFSSPDIVVASNCEAVRLTVNGTVVGTKDTRKPGSRLAHDLVVFPNAFQFMRDWKPLSRKRESDRIQVLAEGLIQGRVVVSQVRRPAQARQAIRVWSDFGPGPIHADGTTLVPLFARVEDRLGTPLVLDDQAMAITLEGPGEIVAGGPESEANPVRPEFGIAPILIRTGSTPGRIVVHVRNLVPRAYALPEGTLTLETVPPPWREVAEERRDPRNPAAAAAGPATGIKVLDAQQREAVQAVSQQQQDFDPSRKR